MSDSAWYYRCLQCKLHDITPYVNMSFSPACVQVRNADGRRMEEVSGELRRARDVTADERKEV